MNELSRFLNSPVAFVLFLSLVFTLYFTLFDKWTGRHRYYFFALFSTVIFATFFWPFFVFDLDRSLYRTIAVSPFYFVSMFYIETPRTLRRASLYRFLSLNGVCLLYPLLTRSFLAAENSLYYLLFCATLFLFSFYIGRNIFLALSSTSFGIYHAATFRTMHYDLGSYYDISGCFTLFIPLFTAASACIIYLLNYRTIFSEEIFSYNKKHRF